MKIDSLPYQELPSISHDNNMGLVRYYLAFSVIIAHFGTLMGTKLWWPTTSYNAVGGFFALSGFLVYGSYLRSKSWRTYIGRRARRILPTYSFIVLLCAFGLVVLSSLSTVDYFTSAQWWKYLVANLTFLNFIEPELPGVFTGNVLPAVNGSLWTLKIEWTLYLSVPLIALLIAKLRKPAIYTFIAVYVCSMLYRMGFSYLYETQGREIWNILSRQVFGQLMYFYTGVVIYFNLRGFLKYKWHIIIAAAIMSVVGEYIPYYEITIGPIVVSVIVLWFSLVGSWGKWGNRNNISYDIYLTHFPVIQLVYALGISPQTTGTTCAFIISMLGIVLLGSISWFGIGRHFLRKPPRH
jgi:peptidoglycan/LPS O-acetylase OafA/YrhL